MNTGFLESQLNKICACKAFSADGINGVPARFYCGNYKYNLKKITDELCPSGKVALFNKENISEEFFNSLGTFLKSIGIRPFYMTFKENVRADIDDLCGAFNLPEDIRAVIVNDKSLFDVSAYFAQVRNIPMVIIPSDYALSGILKTNVVIKNGRKFDLIGITVKKYILIDISVIAKNSLHAAFAGIISRLPALIDYRIYGAVTDCTLNSEAYDLAREAITDAYSKCAENRFDAYTAIKDLYTLEIAGAYKYELFFGSSVEAVKRLLNPFSAVCEPEEELIATSKIIRLYKLWADSENCVLNYVDYMARAEKISEISDADENFILYRLSEQVKQLEKKRGIIKRIKKTLASELKGMCRAMDSAEKFYYSLGGKKISVKNTVRLGKIIRLAGDEPFALNGLSVMREEGLLEPL